MANFTEALKLLKQIKPPTRAQMDRLKHAAMLPPPPREMRRDIQLPTPRNNPTPIPTLKRGGNRFPKPQSI